jgi:hypothetical protein
VLFLKHITLVERDLVLPQQSQVFVFERSRPMMLLLTQDVVADAIYLGFADGKRRIPFLPFKVFDMTGLLSPRWGFPKSFDFVPGARAPGYILPSLRD